MSTLKKPSGFPLGFAMLKIVFVPFKLFLYVVLGKKEFAYCEKTCNTENAGNRAERIVVVYYDRAGDRHDKYLYCICRGEVDEHSHKFKTYEYCKHIFEVIVCGAEIGIHCEKFCHFQNNERKKNDKRDYRNGEFEKAYCRIEKAFKFLTHNNLLS